MPSIVDWIVPLIVVTNAIGLIVCAFISIKSAGDNGNE